MTSNTLIYSIFMFRSSIYGSEESCVSEYSEDVVDDTSFHLSHLIQENQPKQDSSFQIISQFKSPAVTGRVGTYTPREAEKKSFFVPKSSVSPEKRSRQYWSGDELVNESPLKKVDSHDVSMVVESTGEKSLHLVSGQERIVPLFSKSIFYKKVPRDTSTLFSMNRSFRVGWSRNGLLAVGRPSTLVDGKYIHVGHVTLFKHNVLLTNVFS